MHHEKIITVKLVESFISYRDKNQEIEKKFFLKYFEKHKAIGNIITNLCVVIGFVFFFNESTDTHALTLNNVPLFYLFAISGCCVIILLSKILANYHQMKFINRYWGGIPCL